MRHLNGLKKLSRPSDQRLALLRYQARSLILRGEVTTTRAKAKALAIFVQKLITHARKGKVGNLREIRRHIDDRRVILKLTQEIVPKLTSKAGGEISVYSAGQRRGDGAEIAVVIFNTTQ